MLVASVARAKVLITIKELDHQLYKIGIYFPDAKCIPSYVGPLQAGMVIHEDCLSLFVK